MRRTTLRITDELYDQLERLAATEDRSLNAVLTQAARLYVQIANARDGVPATGAVPKESTSDKRARIAAYLRAIDEAVAGLKAELPKAE